MNLIGFDFGALVTCVFLCSVKEKRYNIILYINRILHNAKYQKILILIDFCCSFGSSKNKVMLVKGKN